MARRRAWAGSPPADDEDAVERIVEAAARCVDKHGPAAFSLSKVADELGVSRPTVYRHFASTDVLLSAVGQHAGRMFSEQTRAHLACITDPAEWVVEGIAICIEWLPSRPHLTVLLDAGRSEPFARGFSSSVAIGMTRDVLRASSIDWRARGFGGKDIDELVDLMNRLIASMLVAPPDPPYSKAALRRYLRRWIAPAIEKISVG